MQKIQTGLLVQKEVGNGKLESTVYLSGDTVFYDHQSHVCHIERDGTPLILRFHDLTMDRVRFFFTNQENFETFVLFIAAPRGYIVEEINAGSNVWAYKLTAPPAE